MKAYKPGWWPQQTTVSEWVLQNHKNINFWHILAETEAQKAASESKHDWWKTIKGFAKFTMIKTVFKY